MNRLTAQLPALQAAMVPSTAGGPVPPPVANEVNALIRAISRKARFAEMHMALLTGIDWERIDDIGRRPAGTADRAHLKVPLCEASLIIEHPGAVIDHVYLAFDGLTAALVNMTDTLGRLVNLTYSRAIRKDILDFRARVLVIHSQRGAAKGNDSDLGQGSARLPVRRAVPGSPGHRLQTRGARGVPVVGTAVSTPWSRGGVD